MEIDNFIKELEKINIEPTEHQLNQLKRYYELLREWNDKINLTAITEEAEVYIKHFYDSLTIVQITNLTNKQTLCDVGTGAGIPGIVLKIFYPNLEITLVDSIEKKTNFLKLAINELGLEKIEVVHARAEDLSSIKRDYYDIVVARAVAKLNILIELCIPLLKLKGEFIAYKGNLDLELEESVNALTCLNASINEVKKTELPFARGTRTLLKIIKSGPTNNKYPRQFNQIKKKPL
ncbi:MAG: 16S rRNA (guanine(527)-N(7))-methyltransferase RsmG [Bacilli bacterium]|nr:16S rRNA (guanine(527)-N(7))-methyltransferase RsmG [Bacilli bacterium]